MPDQPTDAGRDRELLDFANRLHGHAVSLRDEFDPNIISGDLDKAAREIRRLVRGREAARREARAAGWDACHRWMKEGRYAE